MFHSIRWRIAVPFIILIITMMVVVSAYLSQFVRQTYLQNIDMQLASQARLASQLLGNSLAENPDPEQLDALARRIAPLIGARVTIIAADGTVVGESHENRALMDNHGSRPEVLEARAFGQGSSTRYSETVGYEMMYTAVAVENDDQLVGYIRMPSQSRKSRPMSVICKECYCGRRLSPPA